MLALGRKKGEGVQKEMWRDGKNSATEHSQINFPTTLAPEKTIFRAYTKIAILSEVFLAWGLDMRCVGLRTKRFSRISGRAEIGARAKRVDEAR